MISSIVRIPIAALVLVCTMHFSIAQDVPAIQWFRSDVQEGTASASYRWAVDGAVSNSESANLMIVTDGHCSLHVNGQWILKNVSMQKSDGNVTARERTMRSRGLPNGRVERVCMIFILRRASS